MRTPTRQSQSGASLLAVLYILITLGVILLVGIKAFPVYMNNHDIQSAIEQVAADPDLRNASAIEIRRAFSRRLDAGYAANVTANDLGISSNGSQRVLSLSYDVRRSLFANIGLVFHFDDSAVLGSTKS